MTCRRREHFYPRRGVGDGKERSVQGNEGRVQTLCKREIRGIVGGELISELPHAFNVDLVTKESNAQISIVVEGLSGPCFFQDPPSQETPHDIHEFHGENFRRSQSCPRVKQSCEI